MLARNKKSLLDLSSVHTTEIHKLFSLADQIRLGQLHSSSHQGFGKTGALLFFEPSTRTRMSFQTAAARWRVETLLLEGKSGTSLEKGETIEDTVLNVDSMEPSFIVIRCGDDVDLAAIIEKVNAPVINAGWGLKGHPTQALLDAYTIYRKFGSCEGQRLLIVGDIRHSRVAASHFELARILNYEVAICGPNDFLPQGKALRKFEKLQDGLQWATIAMALRVQLERHSQNHSLEKYRQTYGFTHESLKQLSEDGLILHPGPVNHNVELDHNVFSDSRCQILEQVKNGVFIRQSLLFQVLNGVQL